MPTFPKFLNLDPLENVKKKISIDFTTITEASFSAVFPFKYQTIFWGKKATRKKEKNLKSTPDYRPKITKQLPIL